MPRGGWLRRLGEMPNDRPAKILIVVGAVAFVCSLLVSSTAQLLEPLQAANREREREQHLREILARVPGMEELIGGPVAAKLTERVIELDTGEEVSTIDAAGFDQRSAALDPQRSIELPAERDIAGIGRRSKYATVYRVERDGELELLILPVHGSGYISTLYGYVVLAGDANTLLDVSFYEHSETPGVGSQVTDARWRAQWRGKRVRDPDGRLRIRVAREPVHPSSSEAVYAVNGITGATRTSQGVSNLLRFWLGDDGFGPYLRNLRSNKE